jgi:hypothetical protein
MLRLLFICLILISNLAFAEQQPTGIGNYATELLEPVNVLSDFMGTGSIILGIACLFGALLRYGQYRVNPLAAPLSTVVILFILGLLLIGLPFIYILIGDGVPFPAH